MGDEQGNRLHQQTNDLPQEVLVSKCADASPRLSQGLLCLPWFFPQEDECKAHKRGGDRAGVV